MRLGDDQIVLQTASQFREAAFFYPYYACLPLDYFIAPVLTNRVRRVSRPDRGGIYYTWLRRPRALGPLGTTPDLRDWRRERGMLWLVDLVPTRGADSYRLIRAVMQDMAHNLLQGTAETVFFWRPHQRRCGTIKLRRPV